MKRDWLRAHGVRALELVGDSAGGGLALAALTARGPQDSVISRRCLRRRSACTVRREAAQTRVTRSPIRCRSRSTEAEVFSSLTSAARATSESWLERRRNWEFSRKPNEPFETDRYCAFP